MSMLAPHAAGRRRQGSVMMNPSSSSSENMLLALPSLLKASDICDSDHYYCCDGSCHDECDAIHYIQTSFGQLLLYMKAAHGEITSYIQLKQLWYDRMYRNEPTLFNHLELFNS